MRAWARETANKLGKRWNASERIAPPTKVITVRAGLGMWTLPNRNAEARIAKAEDGMLSLSRANIYP